MIKRADKSENNLIRKISKEKEENEINIMPKKSRNNNR